MSCSRLRIRGLGMQSSGRWAQGLGLFCTSKHEVDLQQFPHDPEYRYLASYSLEVYLRSYAVFSN